jgi:hypothetical protein
MKNYCEQLHTNKLDKVEMDQFLEKLTNNESGRNRRLEKTTTKKATEEVI